MVVGVSSIPLLVEAGLALLPIADDVHPGLEPLPDDSDHGAHPRGKGLLVVRLAALPR
jgi:hypothetical protein